MGDIAMLKPIADLMFGETLAEIETMLPVIFVVSLLAIVATGIPLAILGYLGISARRTSKRLDLERRGTYQGSRTYQSRGKYQSRGTYHGKGTYSRIQ